MSIHPTAIIEDGAVLGSNPSVGPYSHIGPNVVVGDDCDIKSHVVVDGHTKIGDRAAIFPFACVGAIPQDKKYDGEKTFLEIGDDVVIREHVTIQPGTSSGGGITRVGNSVLLMVGCHVAHDCLLGDHIILVNNSMLGGHVVVEDFAIVGGLSGVHQYVRIGQHAMVGGMSGVDKDVLPFSMIAGERANLKGLNLIGLKRRKFNRNQISDLRDALDVLSKGDGLLSENLDKIRAELTDHGALDELLSFIEKSGNRGLTL